MKKRNAFIKLFYILTLTLSLGGTSSLSAQKADKKDKKETKRGALTVEERLDILAEELEKQKLNKAVKSYKSYGGLGPAASGVYHASNGISWGGYGEIKYRNYKSRYKNDEMDVHRMILYAGYRFNDWIVLNTEFEYEHAGFKKSEVVSSVDLVNQTATQKTINEGEVFVEFAYLDFKFHDYFQLKLGLNLIPMGIVNYMHEPTTFYSVERPLTESLIIPSTWREIGAIFHGELFNKSLVYRAGIINGPQGSNFSSNQWMRGGRTKGSKSKADDLAFVANLEYKGIQSLTLGGSFYTGQAGQKEITAANFQSRLDYTQLTSVGISSELATYYNTQATTTNTAKVRVNLMEAHFDFNKGPFRLRGLAARGWMNEDDTRAVNKSTGLNVGKTVEGAYLETAFNVLSLTKSTHKLYLYVRHEYVNTQKHTVRSYNGDSLATQEVVCAAIPGGICQTSSQLTNGVRDLGIITASDTAKEAYGVTGVADRTYDQRVTSFGLSYFPHPNIALKLDYEKHSSKSSYHSDIEALNASNNKIDRLNMAVTFIF